MSSLLSIGDLQGHQEEQTTFLKEDAAFVFREGQRGQQVHQVLGELEPGKTIHYKTKGKWSTHQVMSYLLQYSGPAQVYLSSYTASEDPIRQIIKHLQEGDITELFCVFDYRVKTYNGSAFQLLE